MPYQNFLDDDEAESDKAEDVLSYGQLAPGQGPVEIRQAVAYKVSVDGCCHS